MAKPGFRLALFATLLALIEVLHNAHKEEAATQA